MKLTLKQKINMASLLAVFVMASVLTWLSAGLVERHTDGAILYRAEGVADTAAKALEDWVEVRADILSAFAEHVTEPNLPAFLQQTRKSAGFYEVFFGTSNGEMFRSFPEKTVDGFDPRTRPWYREAAAAGRTITTTAYKDAVSGENMITMAQPVYKNGQMLGVVGADILIKDIVDIILSLHVGDNAYVALIDSQNGTFLGHPDTSMVLKPVNSRFKELTMSFIQESARKSEVVPFSRAGHETLIFTMAVPNTPLYLELIMDRDTEYASLDTLIKTLMFSAVIITIIIIVLVSWLVSYLFRDLLRVSSALEEIASGEGDLTQRLEPRSSDEVGQLALNFNKFVGNMHTMVTKLSGISQSLSSQSQITAAQAEERSVRITMQQDEINMVATAVNEMAAATQEIAGNSENTAQFSSEAVTASAHGTALVQQTQQSIQSLETEVHTATGVIQELEENGNQISTILSTIQEIADQTNLLALNAAIEAARAGEQGRGFAVVADEVRVLSQRTHASTQEIQTMIETLQSSTSRAVSIMDGSRKWVDTSVNDSNSAAASLVQIQKTVESISDMAVQIASAAEEQSSVTSEITRSMEGIRDVSQDFAQEAQEAAAQAAELSNLSVELQNEINQFKL
ncbi:methyl-accepting chemotaxis protein [Vibrio cincinnatiensis]|uniref:methyl-accepting chemotaxis protein n=1 Tax=Vibrio cincinnatiensis TaxID=675 RepID=UPI001EDD83CA|nr:methyl-accepting chemotaxis protein [Vibrio cincinnatiensis]MCG3728635.1 methyl-accepting chemotaxis protein [Vibrio cincinnatiensis]